VYRKETSAGKTWRGKKGEEVKNYEKSRDRVQISSTLKFMLAMERTDETR